MAGKSNTLKIKKLQINFTDKWFYTFVVIISLIAIGVGVYAAAGTTPNPGHPFVELQPCNTAGEILKSDGTTWTCGADDVGNGGTSLWTQDTDLNIYYNDGNIGIGTTTPGELLDISSISTGKYPLMIRGDIDNDGGYTGIQFGYNGSMTSYLKAKIHVEGTSGNVQPEMHFLLDNTDDSSNADINDAVLSLLPSGNIGIGTIDPSIYKLYVTGPLISTGPLHTTQQGIFEKGIILGTNDTTCSSGSAGMLRYRQNCTESSCSSYFEICMMHTPSSYSWSILVEQHSILMVPPGPLPPTETPEEIQCPSGQTYYWCTGLIVDPGCFDALPEWCYVIIDW